jgi:hypothetical protein
MANLIFLEEPHVYELDGEELPSVSEITRFISRENYSEVPQYVLDNAADRGTRVHKLTEALDKYGEAEADEIELPYLQAYLEFRKKHKVQWEKIEWSTYNKERLYGATIDRYGIVDGEKAIVDLKTTSTLHTVSVTAQLTLYKMACESQGMGVEKLYVLQLKKDGKATFKEIAPDPKLAESCLYLHELLKKKKRKRVSKKEEKEDNKKGEAQNE